MSRCQDKASRGNNKMIEIVILAACALVGFAVVYKLVPSKSPETMEADGRSEIEQPWYEILEVEPSATDSEIKQQYENLRSLYTDEAIQSLDTELREEAVAHRNRIEAAYHFSRFRLKR